LGVNLGKKPRYPPPEKAVEDWQKYWSIMFPKAVERRLIETYEYLKRLGIIKEEEEGGG
jgi:hypothetical protein